MAQFDPALRRETLVFQRTGVMNREGKPCLKFAGFVLAEYDGSPDRYVEPRNMVRRFHDHDTMGNPTVPETDGTLIQSFEFIDSQVINDVVRFDSSD